MCGDFPFEFDLPWQWSPSDLHWQNAWPISSWPRIASNLIMVIRPDSVGNRKKEYMKVLQYYLEVFIYYSVVLLKYTIVTILHVKNHVLSIPRASAGFSTPTGSPAGVGRVWNMKVTAQKSGKASDQHRSRRVTTCHDVGGRKFDQNNKKGRWFWLWFKRLIVIYRCGYICVYMYTVHVCIYIYILYMYLHIYI